jgi:hypothetical protein
MVKNVYLTTGAENQSCGSHSSDIQQEHTIPSSGLKNTKQGFPPAFTLVSCSAYSATLKMGATYYSEMSGDFQWTEGHYIPEAGHMQLDENAFPY